MVIDRRYKKIIRVQLTSICIVENIKRIIFIYFEEFFDLVIEEL